MGNEQDKGYKDTKEFICTGCGKTIVLTKFASQKSCRCDECKQNNVPINPDIVAEALAKNPPKPRKISVSDSADGKTKTCKCVKCGKDTIVSKFMSSAKVLCDECKGTTGSHKVAGLVQRIVPDMSKLDKSKILPIEEYEVNEICIKNGRLRSVVCPACGHEYMKPNMVVDWSQFGLVISYQCTECLATMLLSEQTDRLIKRHSPGKTFDYTGREIEELASSKDQSRHVNIIRKLIKLLDDNNIKIDDDEIIPFRWRNEKPVPIGFTVPDEDVMQESLKHVIDVLDKSDRHGSAVDMPEGSRWIQISHTLASKLSDELKDMMKGENNGCERNDEE